MPTKKTTSKIGARSKAAAPPNPDKKVIRAGHGTRRPRQSGGDEAGDENMVDGQYVVALARGLEVLCAFRAGTPRMGNHDFAERTGLPKPTISRITHTLTKLGFLSYVPRAELYELGPEALAEGTVRRTRRHARRKDPRKDSSLRS